MASSLLLSIVLLLLLLLSTYASAFNITRLLGQFPEFGAFNDLLTQTHLNSEINSRLTITVLAVANDSIGAISGKPLDVQKRILSNHVILDFYDTFKLQRLKKSSSLLLTTLYQSTGIAQRQQGFLNVSVTSGGIVFGSAVRGSPLNAKLLAGVASRPYNISVLQVSSPIVAPGMDPNEPLPPVVPSPKKEAPPPPPVAETPDQATSPEEETASPSPADPPADSPAAEPPNNNKKHKAAAADDEEADDLASSSASSITAGVAVVVGLVSCLIGCMIREEGL